MKVIALVKSLELAYQIHLLAFFMFVSSLVVTLASPASKVGQQALLLISLFGFGVGFVLWCWPAIHRVWRHPLGKVAISIGHVFVLLLAAVIARFVVASELGLQTKQTSRRR